MTRDEARSAAQRHLDELGADPELELAINDEITEEHPQGLVFFYNTRDYWRTRDPMTALAGNGPLLVTSEGAVVPLPTNQSLSASLAEVAGSAGAHAGNR